MPRVLNKRTDNIPKDAVYGGRGGPYGNPYVIGMDGTRKEVIQKYREYLFSNPELLVMVKKERGRDWVCWCAPKPCHCDVNLEVANLTK